VSAATQADRRVRAVTVIDGVLEDSWLLMVCVPVLATAWPWLSRAADVEFGAVAAGALAFGLLLAAALMLARRAPAGSLRRWAPALNAAGICVLGFVWLHAGGLQNPAFMLAFVLPVIGASAVGRRQIYIAAALCIAVAASVALIQAPEFRWYVAGFGRTGARLASFFAAAAGPGGAAAFPGFSAPPNYFVVSLEVFAVLIAACALIAERVATVAETLGGRLATAHRAAERALGFGAQLIEQLPIATAIVEADTLKVLSVSEAFVSAQWAPAGDTVGRVLVEAIPFCYPEMVEAALAGAGGRLRPCPIRVNGELLALELRIQHVVHDGRRLALVTLDDMTLQLCARAAIDASDDPVLIVDAGGAVLAHNQLAALTFGVTGVRSNISSLAPGGAPSSRWWEPGIRGRRTVQLHVGQRLYRVTSTAVVLPGEAECICVVRFAARAASWPDAEPPGDATLVIPTLAQAP
jgi:PAS domain-containing protein